MVSKITKKNMKKNIEDIMSYIGIKKSRQERRAIIMEILEGGNKMAKNLRKGSKVFVKIGLKGKKTIPGIVVSASGININVRISKFARGRLAGRPIANKVLTFLPQEIRRRL